MLGLSDGLRGEIAKNAGLRSAPARPAGEIYTGVLYDALSLATLSPAAKRRAARSLLIFSGLWGAVRIKDRIPAYRCAGGVGFRGWARWPVLARAAGGSTAGGRRGRGWCWTCARPRTRRCGRRRASSPNAPSRYGCCSPPWWTASRSAPSSATSTRRRRAGSWYEPCWRPTPPPYAWRAGGDVARSGVCGRGDGGAEAGKAPVAGCGGGRAVADCALRNARCGNVRSGRACPPWTPTSPRPQHRCSILLPSSPWSSWTTPPMRCRWPGPSSRADSP